MPDVRTGRRQNCPQGVEGCFPARFGLWMR